MRVAIPSKVDHIRSVVTIEILSRITHPDRSESHMEGLKTVKMYEITKCLSNRASEERVLAIAKGGRTADEALSLVSFLFMLTIRADELEPGFVKAWYHIVHLRPALEGEGAFKPLFETRCLFPIEKSPQSHKVWRRYLGPACSASLWV